MKFTISRSELADALRVVSKGLSSRSTLPVLSGILLSVKNNVLTLESTDLELAVRHVTTALTDSDGDIVVPGSLFTNIVSNLPEAAVTCALEGRTLHITCLTSAFQINTLSPDDFPSFPTVDPDRSITIPAVKAAGMVRQVAKAISRDESRAILTGILLSVSEDNLRFVATDSYRLAVRETKLDEPVGQAFDVVIPGRIFDDVMKAAASFDEISLGFSENQIVMTFDTTTFVTRRIEGNFPNYQQLLPKEHATTAVVETGEFITAVKRVALLAQHQSSVKLGFSVEDQDLNLSSNIADIGSAVEDIPAKVEGDDVAIAFNHQYLLDGLNSIHTTDVLIEIQSTSRPGIFKATDEEMFLYLVMPVRLG